jgi:site-specific DNA-cytosine methylase
MFVIQQVCSTFAFMKQSIELFSGSGHVSEVFRELGFKTLTIDFNQSLKPDICCNILNLDISTLPRNVTIFWASPDCSKLSRAASQRHWIKKTVKYRIYDYTPATKEAEISLSVVARTVQIIRELNPKVWFIENPVGRIHHTAALKSIGHYRYAVNYADWGFPYSKETFIFTNQILPLPTKVQRRHVPGLHSVAGSYNRSLIPKDLVRFLVSHSQF